MMLNVDFELIKFIEQDFRPNNKANIPLFFQKVKVDKGNYN